MCTHTWRTGVSTLDRRSRWRTALRLSETHVFRPILLSSVVMGRKTKFSSKWSTDATPIGPGRKSRKQPAPKLPKQLGKYYIFPCVKLKIFFIMHGSGRILGSCILKRTSIDTSTDASVDISIVTWSTLKRHATNMSIDCRLRVNRCFGRASTDVRRGIDRDHIGSISVNYRRDIGQLSVECRSCIIR